MVLSVREALKKTALKHGKLLAGTDGLDNNITWVTIVEVLEDFKRLAEGELLITTAYGVEGQSGKQKCFIQNLAEKKISGVAIITGFYLSEISDEFIEEANKYKLPLIELPSFINFSDITRSILHKIIQIQYELLDFSEYIHQELLQLMLSNKSFPSIAEFLAKHSGGNVAVYDINWEPVAVHTSTTLKNANQKESVIPFMSEELREVLNGREIAFYESAEGNVRIINMAAPIAAEDKMYGYIVLTKPIELLTKIDRISLRHAVMVCALEFLKLKAITETEWKMQGDFLDEILSRKWINTSAIMERCKNLGFNFSMLHNVFIIKQMNTSGITIINKNLYNLCEISKQVFQKSNITIYVKLRRNSLLLLLEGQKLDREEISAAAQEILERWAAKAPNTNIIIGIGNNRSSIEQLPRCGEEAELSLKFGHFLKSRNQICFYADLGIFHWLIDLYEQKVDLRAMRDNILGNLIAYDHKHGNQLMETLENYLALNQNIQQTASALYIHRHTLKYRLSRIEAKTGMKLKNHQHRIQLQMAIYIHKFLKALE